MPNLNLPITREEAIESLRSMPQTEADMNHYLESEAVMQALAKKLGKTEKEIEYWAMLGLLHDIDWTVTHDNVQSHLTKAPQMLRDMGFDEDFISIVVSHGYGFDCAGLLDKKRTKEIEHALAASETLTGIIYAYALMRGKMISNMDVSGLKKKFKDKRFAANCNREIVREIENLIPLDEFFSVAIEGMKNIKREIWLE